MSYPKLTASQLKAAFEKAYPESLFFNKDTMRFFGDTMGNYYVPTATVQVIDRDLGCAVQCYELQRKKPVKHGLQDSAFFDCITLKRIKG